MTRPSRATKRATPRKSSRNSVRQSASPRRSTPRRGSRATADSSASSRSDVVRSELERLMTATSPCQVSVFVGPTLVHLRDREGTKPLCVKRVISGALKRRAGLLHRVVLGPGSDLSKAPVIRVQAGHAGEESSPGCPPGPAYIPTRLASRRSWRYTASESRRLRERMASFLVLPSSTLPQVVVPTWSVEADLTDGGDVQRVVELAVAARVEAVALLRSRGGLNGR